MKLLLNRKLPFALKELVVVSLAVALSIALGVLAFLNLKKEVIIYDSGRTVFVRTVKSTVGEVLEQCGIEVGPDDYINLNLYSKLNRTKPNRIFIKRAVPVYIAVDGQEKKVMTYRDFLGEVLIDAGIKMQSQDRLKGGEFSDRVSSGMRVGVVRVREEYLTEMEDIEYETVTRQNDWMDQGTEKVVRDGKNGTREKVYRIVYEDNIEVSRSLVRDRVAVEPVDRLVEVGTVTNFRTSRGELVRYKKVLDMRATAYTACYEDTGKHPDHPAFGITYTGIKAKRGIVAVDPKVIPLGTRLYVQGVGDTPDYGFALAADIGSAVKGDIIDLYLDTREEVLKWGCKKVKVYILAD